MPTYEYECLKCKTTFEAEQKISDPPLKICPSVPTLSLEERSSSFNDTTGAITWNRRSAAEHPHACRCQAPETTPHKHYGDAPFACARCSECEAYDPARPPPVCGGEVRRLIAGSTGFVLNGRGWFRDGY